MGSGGSHAQEAEDGLQQDSSFSYQDDGAATVRIDMPRKHGKSKEEAGSGNGLHLDDPFADIPVDDDDDLASFLDDELEFSE